MSMCVRSVRWGGDGAVAGSSSVQDGVSRTVFLQRFMHVFCMHVFLQKP